MFRNFKMKFEYRYIINDGAVICFAKPAMESSIVHTWANYHFMMAPSINTQIRTQLLPEYKGVARLKNGDTSDIEIAKDVARSKAVRAAFKNYRNYLAEIFDYMARELYDFGGTIMSIDKKISAVDEEIQELTIKD